MAAAKDANMNKFKRSIIDGVEVIVEGLSKEEYQDLVDTPDPIENSEASRGFRLSGFHLDQAAIHLREAKKPAPEQTDIISDLPLYDCHKQVRALQIMSVDHGFDGVVIYFVEAGYLKVKHDLDFAQRHSDVLKPGNYYMLYKDGYVSISPEKAFVDGYSLVAKSHGG